METPQPVTWLLEITSDFTDPDLLSGEVNQKALIEGYDFRFEAWPKVEGPVVACGTFNCLTGMLRQTGIANAVFDDYAQLRCSVYYAYLYPYLKRLSFIVPLAAAAHMDLQKLFGKEVFIRPNSNKKPFEARVVPLDELDDYLQQHHAFMDDLVVLSEVIEIQREFRCFCRNGEVFAHSSYLEDEYQAAPLEVLTLAGEIARLTLEKSGMNMLTVDLAATPEGLCSLKSAG